MDRYWYEGAHSIDIGLDGTTAYKNTWTTYHLMPAEKPMINPATPKTEYVNIAGANGSLDYTEALGGVKYENITGSWEFIIAPDYKWNDIYAALINDIHGQHVKVVMSYDNEYYYEGRLSLNSIKSSEQYNTITLDYNFLPIKYPLSTSADKDWLWDRHWGTNEKIHLVNFVVNGTKHRTFVNENVDGEEIPIRIYTTDAVVVEYRGVQYPINAGRTKEFMLSPGNNRMIFTGTTDIRTTYERSAKLG